LAWQTGVTGFDAIFDPVTATYSASVKQSVVDPGRTCGRQRPLGIPTVRDRVIQMAAKLVVEPIF
jgi:hypothetical protein